MRLIYHPLPGHQEGLNGFLLRLAEGNGLAGSGELFGQKPPSPDVLAGYIGLEGDDDSIARLFRQRGPGAKGTLRLWNHRTSRYCPLCWRDEKQWRQEWELTLLTACPQHGCRLVDRCQSCGLLLDWRRKSLGHCRSEHSLGILPSQQASAAELALAQLLIDKLNLKKGAWPEHLQLLRLEQLHRLATVIGAYANTHPGMRVLKVGGVADLKATLPLAGPAAEILADWPGAFYLLLDRLRGENGEAESGSKVGQRFAHFHRHFSEYLTDANYGFVAHAFLTYLENQENWILGARNKRLSANLVRKPVWIPVGMAAQQLRTSSRRVKTFVESGNIRGNWLTAPNGKSVLCVNRHELPAVRSVLADLVDQKTACALLGVGLNRLLELANHHVLGAAVTPKSSGVFRWAPSRSFLDNLLTLGSDLPTAQEGECAETVSFAYALRFWFNREYLFPRLIVDVIKGEIAPIAKCREKIGLAAWTFDRKQLRKWMSDQMGGRRDGAMTIPEGADYLSMRNGTLSHLVALGLVSSVIEKDSFHRLVERSALDEFKNAYALGQELGDRLGITASHVARLRENRGQWLSQFPLGVIEMGRMLEVSEELFSAVSATAQQTAERPAVVLERWATIGHVICEAHSQLIASGTESNHHGFQDVVQRLKQFMERGTAANIQFLYAEASTVVRRHGIDPANAIPRENLQRRFDQQNTEIIDQMKRFMAEAPGTGSGTDIKKLIEDGRP